MLSIEVTKFSVAENARDMARNAAHIAVVIDRLHDKAVLAKNDTDATLFAGMMDEASRSAYAACVTAISAMLTAFASSEDYVDDIDADRMRGITNDSLRFAVECAITASHINKRVKEFPQ
jgi:hypothetical protein